MSQENVEIIRRGFAAWEEGDLAANLRLIDEQVVCRRTPKTGFRKVFICRDFVSR
jgi:ketosteroid isomerase-like protein